jgi:hypothetical protein
MWPSPDPTPYSAVAREAGLFEKNGLRLEVAYIRSGTRSAGERLYARNVMDLRVVKQLEDSGFIKGLYPKG